MRPGDGWWISPCGSHRGWVAAGNGRWQVIGVARTEADQALLVDGHVEHALLPKLFPQPHGAAEDSSKRDVLAKHDGRRVGTQSYPARDGPGGGGVAREEEACREAGWNAQRMPRARGRRPRLSASLMAATMFIFCVSPSTGATAVDACLRARSRAAAPPPLRRHSNRGNIAVRRARGEEDPRP